MYTPATLPVAQVLRELGPTRLQTLAKELDLPRMRVHAYLTTLRARGLVHQLARGLYALAPGAPPPPLPTPFPYALTPAARAYLADPENSALLYPAKRL